jgi:hypothetical protein
MVRGREGLYVWDMFGCLSSEKTLTIESIEVYIQRFRSKCGI